MRTTYHLCVLTYPEMGEQVIYKNESLLGLLNELSKEFDNKFHNEDEFLFFIGEANSERDEYSNCIAHFHDIVF